MQLLAIPRRKVNIAKGEVATAIKTFLAGKAIKGQGLKLFENKFADCIGVKYAFAVSSGRAAFRIILKVLDLPAGSEIMIPAHTDESVPWAIMQEGLKPIFLDVKKDDGNINIKEIERNLNKNTKAIVATHIFGNICDIEEILEICNKHKIIVIEDCAHAPAVTLKNKKVGSFGKLSYFSFSTAKHFGAYGGGCLLTNDGILADKISVFLTSCKTVSSEYLIKELLFGWIIALITVRTVFTLTLYPVLLISSLFTKEDVLITVYNKVFKREKNKKLDIRRMSNLQAGIALNKLNVLELEDKKRKENADTLRNNLNQQVLDLEIKPREGSNYYFYILEVADKYNLSRKLLWSGIDTGKFLMRNVAALCKDKKSYPVTEWIYDHSLQIPIYSSLSKKDMLHLAKVINKCFEN